MRNWHSEMHNVFEADRNMSVFHEKDIMYAVIGGINCSNSGATFFGQRSVSYKPVSLAGGRRFL